MPTQLGIAHNPKTSYYPPGLSREDHFLYAHWRERGATGALSFYFNVRMGKGRDPGPDCDPEVAGWWYQCTAKRADLVADYEDRVEIVEFRFNASSNAIGRLLCYKQCWEEDPVIPKPLVLRLVTNIYDRDVETLCKQFAIFYEVLS